MSTYEAGSGCACGGNAGCGCGNKGTCGAGAASPTRSLFSPSAVPPGFPPLPAPSSRRSERLVPPEPADCGVDAKPTGRIPAEPAQPRLSAVSPTQRTLLLPGLALPVCATGDVMPGFDAALGRFLREWPTILRPEGDRPTPRHARAPPSPAAPRCRGTSSSAEQGRLLVHELGHVYLGGGHCSSGGKNCCFSAAAYVWRCRVRAQLGLPRNAWWPRRSGDYGNADGLEYVDCQGCGSDSDVEKYFGYACDVGTEGVAGETATVTARGCWPPALKRYYCA